MSSAVDAISTAPDALARPPRTYTRQVIGRTFAFAGAKLGGVWIAVLIVLAVFAPLLANSRPILLRHEDRWSSPLLTYLTPADVVLFIVFITAGALMLMRRISGGRKLLTFLAVAAVAIPVCWWLVRPPLTSVFETWRQLERAGEIQYTLHTPIPYSPTDRMRDQYQLGAPAPPYPPGPVHWLGTDSNGADLLSRMIHASRIALSIGFISTGIAMFIGVILGGLMGYFSRAVDLVGMRLVEIFEAIPTLFLLITFVAFFGRDLYIMMAIIGLTSWTSYARFIRAEFLRLRQQDFVQAARAAGLPLRSILFRHMLPNGMAPVLVSASFGVASAILAESILSFLGLGLVDEPSWGQMLDESRGQGGAFYWWIAIFPGLAIFLTVFAYNLVGEALRDAIDPYVSRD